MKQLILICAFVFGTTLFGADNNSTIYHPSEQTIVVSYDEIPLKLYKNQIFAIKLKALLGTNGAPNISYTASKDDGIKLLNQGTQFSTNKDGTTTLTLLYKVISDKIRTPDLL